jgi:hypothetical protein
VEAILRLLCIFSLFECVHALIKVAQGRDIFVCDFVEAVKIAQQEFYMLYSLIEKMLFATIVCD